MQKRNNNQTGANELSRKEANAASLPTPSTHHRMLLDTKTASESRFVLPLCSENAEITLTHGTRSSTLSVCQSVTLSVSPSTEDDIQFCIIVDNVRPRGMDSVFSSHSIAVGGANKICGFCAVLCRRNFQQQLSSPSLLLLLTLLPLFVYLAARLAVGLPLYGWRHSEECADSCQVRDQSVFASSDNTHLIQMDTHVTPSADV